MNERELHRLWNDQAEKPSSASVQSLIGESNKQRRLQVVSIVVMGTTAVLVLIYALYYGRGQWTTFQTGLSLMIGSLTIRIAVEISHIFRKENQLVTLSPVDFQKYLRDYYQSRQWIHFLLTPLCLGFYVLGFMLLLPYFEASFSTSFYRYIQVSGALSGAVLTLIIIRGIRKELAILQNLKR